MPLRAAGSALALRPAGAGAPRPPARRQRRFALPIHPSIHPPTHRLLLQQPDLVPLPRLPTRTARGADPGCGERGRRVPPSGAGRARTGLEAGKRERGKREFSDEFSRGWQASEQCTQDTSEDKRLCPERGARVMCVCVETYVRVHAGRKRDRWRFLVYLPEISMLIAGSTSCIHASGGPGILFACLFVCLSVSLPVSCPSRCSQTENPSLCPIALPVPHRRNVTSNMPVNSLPGWERNWSNVFCNLTSQ